MSVYQMVVWIEEDLVTGVVIQSSNSKKKCPKTTTKATTITKEKENNPTTIITFYKILLPKSFLIHPIPHVSA